MAALPGTRLNPIFFYIINLFVDLIKFFFIK